MKQLTGQYRPNVPGILKDKLAYGIIVFFLVLSIIAPFIANEKPIYVDVESERIWPIFSETNWNAKCQDRSCKKFYTLIPFSPSTLDIRVRHKPPGSKSVIAEKKRHLLGTDGLGRDILSILIHGSRTALWISVFSVLIAFGFGLIYGMTMGYFGNNRLKMSAGQIIILFILILLTVYLMKFITNLRTAFNIGTSTSVLMLLSVFGIFILLWRWCRGILKNATSNISIGLDNIGMRIIDMIKALPALFIILFILQLLNSPHVYYLILLIAFLIWPTFARHARAETMRLSHTSAVQSAVLMGRGDLSIWRYEILPYVIRPLLVTLAFSIASAIILEATLSFLGIGMPADHVSWGSLINEARQHPSSWWLLFFPGVCMLALIWSFQHLGRTWENRLQKSKRFVVMT